MLLSSRQQESPVSCAGPEQHWRPSWQHDNIPHPLPGHRRHRSDHRQGRGGPAPAAAGGLFLCQNCRRRGNRQDRGEHLQLGQWQSQGKSRLCGELRVRDVQDGRDDVGHPLPADVPDQVSRPATLTRTYHEGHFSAAVSFMVAEQFSESIQMEAITRASKYGRTTGEWYDWLHCQAHDILLRNLSLDGVSATQWKAQGGHWLAGRIWGVVGIRRQLGVAIPRLGYSQDWTTRTSNCLPQPTSIIHLIQDPKCDLLLCDNI